MTQRQVLVEKGSYRDSISLMKISNEVSALGGVRQAAATMATPLNKRLLRDIGFQGKEIELAGPDDLIVAVEGVDSKSVAAGMSKIRELLEAKAPATGGSKAALPATLEEASKLMPDANLALISVPGEFAGREASKALDGRLNVFLFSSNVPVEKEVELKQRAVLLGLLVMGPDCGTAIINGVVLGFGNVVRKGSIGLVSASGTGLQQVSTLVHAAGLGVSQAIGTGGKDLSDEVGGLTTAQALRLLAADPDTDVVVVISKPPAAKTMAKTLREAGSLGKPVVVNFLGRAPSSVPRNCSVASTLEEAALRACALASRGGAKGLTEARSVDGLRTLAAKESAALSASQRYVRGLFSGGTLCYESQVVMGGILGEISSNAPLNESSRLKSADSSVGHTCVDLGAEEFVVGRAHPMMDYTLRKLRIIKEAKDPGVAVILLDVVLGYGSNPDPAGQLVPAVLEARSIASKAGRHIAFVASIVGTDGDPQGMAGQAKKLAEAGVILLPSNARASLVAALIAARAEDATLGRLGSPRRAAPRVTEKAARRTSGRADSLLGKKLKVINLGVGTFAEDLRTQGVPVQSVDWKPPAGGDLEVLGLLDKLR